MKRRTFLAATISGTTLVITKETAMAAPKRPPVTQTDWIQTFGTSAEGGGRPGSQYLINLDTVYSFEQQDLDNPTGHWSVRLAPQGEMTEIFVQIDQAALLTALPKFIKLTRVGAKELLGFPDITIVANPLNIATLTLVTIPTTTQSSGEQVTEVKFRYQEMARYVRETPNAIKPSFGTVAIL